MYSFLIKALVWIHNFTYRAIGVLVIKENGGIHPKHDIIKYEDFFLKHIKQNSVVLDIGCGNGALDFILAQQAAQVIGIDISPKKIAFAKKRFQKDNIQYIVGDATKYQFDKKPDIVILSNVLEHIRDRRTFLTKASKLAPIILIRVPLITRDWLAIYKKEHGYEYRLDNTHYIEYTSESFEKEIRKSGFHISSSFTRFGELYAVTKRKDES